MKFFNKKQDVLDIQLTSYGKKKLADGRFKPAFYCFFDDNIIYDGSYAALTEEQNDIQTRIFENMQYLKINPIAKGPETKIKERNKEIFEGDNDILEIKDYYGDNLQNVEDRDTICKYMLGNSTIDKQKAPSFVLNSLGAAFQTSNFQNYYTGSGFVQEIPQIDINFTHSAVKTLPGSMQEKNEYQKHLYPSDELLGDFTIQLKGDYLVLDLLEKNTDYLTENFEFEVFEIVTKQTGSRTEDVAKELIPLQLRNVSGVQSNDPAESFMDNYFEIIVDNNIPSIFRDAIGNIDNSQNANIETFTESTTRASNERMRDTTSTYTGNDQDPEDCS